MPGAIARGIPLARRPERRAALQCPCASTTNANSMLSPSVSGSKYVGRNETFWEMGGEALIT